MNDTLILDYSNAIISLLNGNTRTARIMGNMH